MENALHPREAGRKKRKPGGSPPVLRALQNLSLEREKARSSFVENTQRAIAETRDAQEQHRVAGRHDLADKYEELARQLQTILAGMSEGLSLTVEVSGENVGGEDGRL